MEIELQLTRGEKGTSDIWAPNFALLARRNAFARIFNRKVDYSFPIYRLTTARRREFDAASGSVVDRIADLRMRGCGGNCGACVCVCAHLCECICVVMYVRVCEKDTYEVAEDPLNIGHAPDHSLRGDVTLNFEHQILFFRQLRAHQTHLLISEKRSTQVKRQPQSRDGITIYRVT